MKILNLTQHAASADQIVAGVVEPADKGFVQALITFDEMPSAVELRLRAEKLAQHAKAAGVEAAMIGGAPYFMAPLEAALRRAEVKPLYAFSRRESKEHVLPDGSIKKTQVFRHAGFVEA